MFIAFWQYALEALVMCRLACIQLVNKGMVIITIKNILYIYMSLPESKQTFPHIKKKKGFAHGPEEIILEKVKVWKKNGKFESKDGQQFLCCAMASLKFLLGRKGVPGLLETLLDKLQGYAVVFMHKASQILL